jgi:hypothetical protein
MKFVAGKNEILNMNLAQCPSQNNCHGFYMGGEGNFMRFGEYTKNNYLSRVFEKYQDQSPRRIRGRPRSRFASDRHS